MKKGTRIIFISHLGNWGVKRARLKEPLTAVIQFKLQQRKWEMVQDGLTGWTVNCNGSAAASKPPQPSPQQDAPMALG